MLTNIEKLGAFAKGRMPSSMYLQKIFPRGVTISLENFLSISRYNFISTRYAITKQVYAGKHLVPIHFQMSL